MLNLIKERNKNITKIINELYAIWSDLDDELAGCTLNKLEKKGMAVNIRRLKYTGDKLCGELGHLRNMVWRAEQGRGQ